MQLEAWWCVCVGVCVSLPLLYLLWKYHPSYGANRTCFPTLPIIGCVPFVLLNKHRLYEWTCEVFDRSPSLLLRNTLGTSIYLSIANPHVVHHILKTNFSCYHKGPEFYAYFNDLLGNGIFNCDGSLWRFQRKVASHVFTSNSLKDFVILIANVEICKRLLPALDSACRFPSNHVDLQALLMDYTFDTICQLTFGADPSCLHVINDDVQAIHGANHTTPNDATVPTSYMEVPHDLIHGFVQGFEAASQIIAERFLVPRFMWETKKFLKIGSEKKLPNALEDVRKFTDFVINQSKKELGDGKERKDLLARFMQLSKSQVESLLEGEDEATWKSNSDYEHGQTLSDSLLKDILLSFVLAGRESVASGVTFFMWLLCIHPRVEKAILEEIKGILKDRKSKQGHGDTLEEKTFLYDEIKKMNYLHAALSESMRLYPPVPIDIKYATQDDIFPDGTKVFKGNQVAYNVLAMGRAERVWGKDCLEFRPERWLNEDGQYTPASPYKYPVFQGGPRICIGKDFAFIQMKLLAASLIRYFEFAVHPRFKPTLSFNLIMTMVNGLPLTLKRRSESIC